MAVKDMIRSVFPADIIDRALRPTALSAPGGGFLNIPGVGQSDASYQATVRAYKGNEIVSAAVNLLSSSAAEPHIIGRRYRRNRPQVRAEMRHLNAQGVHDTPGRWAADSSMVRNGFWETLDSHPLVNLLNSPNPYQDRAEFWAQVVMDYYLAGNAYVLKARYSEGLLAGAVGELWRLRPDRVKPIPGDMSKGEPYLKGYEYRIDAQTTRQLPAKDVLHFKTQAPLNPYEGVSPIVAALERVAIDQAMRTFLRTFYQRGGASVGGALNVKTTGNNKLDQKQKDDIRQRFRGMFNGGQYDVLVTTADDVQYTPFGLDRGLRDALPKEIDNVNEARIAMVLRIPPGILGLLIGLETSSYANQRQAWASLWYVTMTPLLSRLEAVLNRSLVPEFGGIDEVVFDLSDINALHEDEDELQERARRNYAAGLAGFHESRVKIGLAPEAPAGELFAVPTTATLTPVERLGEAPEPTVVDGASTDGQMSGEVANAIGILFRSGYTPEGIAKALGIPEFEHTGLLPVTLRTEEAIEAEGAAATANRAGRPRIEDDPSARALYDEAMALHERYPAMTWAQVAARVSVSERTLREYRKRFES